MNPSQNQHPSNDSYDYFIAFIVIVGAFSFILQQSFPNKVKSKNSSAFQAQTVEKDVSKPSKYVNTVTNKEINLYEKYQQEQVFEEEVINKWTTDLEIRGIKNTSFTIPPAVNKSPIATPTDAALKIIASEEVVPQTEVTSPVLVEKQSVFIDTDIKEAPTVVTPSSADTAIENLVKTKEITSLIKPTTPISKTQTPVNSDKLKAPTKEKEPIVDTYEATSPAITSTQNEFVEKGVESQKSIAKNDITRKTSEEKLPCFIVIAALQDAENIKKLVKSLQEEKYTVFNKQAGKYRSIGIRTACEPSVYQPLLQKIKKDYSKDAWFSKNR